MQVYLPDDLDKLVKRRRRPASELLQHAVRTEIRRLELIAAGDKYVADLVAEVMAERGGTVLMSDPRYLQALATHAERVDVVPI